MGHSLKGRHLWWFLIGAIPAGLFYYGMRDHKDYGMSDIVVGVFRELFVRDARPASLAMGILIGAGLKTCAAIYNRPGLHATIDSVMMQIRTGNPEVVNPTDAVGLLAGRIVSILAQRGVTPKRVAVDGVPGSGKTVLSIALSTRLGLSCHTLDHIDMDSFVQFVDGAIYEHHRLLRTQDIDGFDVVIYIDEPVELSIEKILARKRGGYLVDLLDFNRLKRMGMTAFSIIDGEEICVPDSFIKIKIAPNGGFNSYPRLVSDCRERGISIEGLSREEMLFFLTESEVHRGFKAYINASAFMREILISIANVAFRRY